MSASAALSKLGVAAKAMRQVSPSTLLGVKSPASLPLSVQVSTASVLSASARL